MKVNDVVSGSLAAAFAVIILLGAQSFPDIPGQKVGPRVFPELIAAGLLLCAALLVARGMRSRARQPWLSVPAWLHDGRTALRFVMVPLALAFYIAASEALGFIPVSILLLVALFMCFGVRLRRALMLAVAGALLIHFLFYKLLKVPLPWGLLSPYAW